MYPPEGLVAGDAKMLNSDLQDLMTPPGKGTGSTPPKIREDGFFSIFGHNSLYFRPSGLSESYSTRREQNFPIGLVEIVDFFHF